MELSAAQFDNAEKQRAKAKQPKQLGLFGAKEYMSDEARWPRGYTPERSAEVDKAFEKTKFVVQSKDHLADHDLAIQSIKRSTIPVEDLDHVDSISTHYNVPMAQVAMGSYQPHDVLGRPTSHVHVYSKMKEDRLFDEGAHYGYTPDDFRAEHEEYTGRPYEEHRNGTAAAMARGVIHEMGHHAGNLPHLDRRSDWYYSVPQERQEAGEAWLGGEEARAENYADEHYVPDHRVKYNDTVSGYDTNMAWHLHQREMDPSYPIPTFVAHYAATRNLSGPQFQGTIRDTLLSPYDREQEFADRKKRAAQDAQGDQGTLF